MTDNIFTNLANTPFKTIAGRWKDHAAGAQFDLRLSKKEQTFALMMFFSGFGAALEAVTEVGAYPEEEAMKILAALHHEWTDFTVGVVAASNVGQTPS